MAESSTSSTSMAIPPALAFLVSNIQSLVTIKLDSTNYLLWKTLILNVMRANGFMGYLDGTNKAPAARITDTNNNLVISPEYTKWCLIDSQLLSCLTATLSAGTLPLVLGFEHAYQVWQSLESRFNSLTRTHVHEFKRRLYNITKTGTMESYIDQIKDYANRLAAVGFPVSDDDLVFHTINGLPEEEFKGFRTAIHTRGGTFTFDELVTMLNAESLTSSRNTTLESVFLTTSRPVSVTPNTASSTSVNMFTPPSFQSQSSHVLPTSTNAPMVPHVSQSQPAPDTRSFNRNRSFDNNGRRNGSNYPGSYAQGGCQICGKTNHIAYYCYHRQNLNLPPPVQYTSGSSQHFRDQWRPSQGYNSHGRGQHVYFTQGHQANFVSVPQPYSTPGFSEVMSGPAYGFSGASQFNGTPQFVSQIPVGQGSFVPQNSFASASVPSQHITAPSALGPQTFDTIDSSGSLLGAPPHQVGLSPQAYQVGSVPPSPQSWLFDSGATSHVTHDISNLSSQQSYTGTQGLSVGNGATIPITHSGTGLLPTPYASFSLNNLLHAPHISHNLLSVYQFSKDNNCFIVFDSHGFVIQDKVTHQILYKGPCHQGLYPLLNSSRGESHQANLCSTSSTMLWHQRLGHPSSTLFLPLIKQLALPVPKLAQVQCTSCHVAKSHKLQFPLSVSHSSVPFQLVHADVWGPSPIPSFQGFKYYLLLIDDCTRYSWLFPLHYKSQVKDKLVQFKAFVSTQFKTSIQIVRSDNGGEFINNYLLTLFLNAGMLHQTSCPHTPEQNGVVERKHRHLIETTVTLLHQAGLPLKFWLEALLTAVYLTNRLPHSTLNFQVPYTLLYHVVPDYFSLKTFGCECYPWLKPYTPHKLLPKSTTCVFLGYCDTTKGYRCFDPITNKVYVSRHVKFVEPSFPYSQLVSATADSIPLKLHIPSTNFDDLLVSVSSFIPTSSSSTPPISSSSNANSGDVSLTSTVPNVSASSSHVFDSSTDVSIPASSCSDPAVIPLQTCSSHPMITRSKHGISKPKQLFSLLTTFPSSSVSSLSSFPTVEPRTFSEANKHGVWQKAMDEEYKALLLQGTWTLVEPPPHAHIIGCQWIFKIKRHSDGSVARYKARLVANGNQQEEGLDFYETFSPVVKQPTIRVALSLALHHNWPLRQLDVSNAFLHGLLEEEVYMKQPLGYRDPSQPHHVCKLQKALYGLRQAPRAWYSTFSTFLISSGFVNSKTDSSLFIYSKGSVVTLVLVYVDDIIITGSSDEFITDFISLLGSQFAMKDLGSLNFFLGIEVQYVKSGLILSQTKYAQELLQKAGMFECKSSSTPASVKPSSCAEAVFSDVTLFRTLVGSLQYLTLTRPEISHAVNVVCQHMHAPQACHYALVKRILRYLKGTLSHGLHFTSGPLVLTAYADADWAGDSSDRRSTTGFCIFLGSNLLSWCAKKQPTVARSSTEAEYRALAQCTADIVWLHQLLDELHVSSATPYVLWCDNSSAIALANNPVFHARTKHIEVDYHFIREKVLARVVQVLHIGTAAQIADIFTKPLSRARFQLLKDKLMVGASPSSVCRGVLDE